LISLFDSTVWLPLNLRPFQPKLYYVYVHIEVVVLIWVSLLLKSINCPLSIMTHKGMTSCRICSNAVCSLMHNQ